MTLYRWFAWPLNCSYTFCMHNKPISAIVLGAGMRGADAYAPYALAYPDQLDIVGVAEPDAVRRHRFAAAHDIAPANSFTTWQAVFDRPKFADVVINTTQDQMHFASTVAALEAGYDVLLEKPITNTLAETVQLVQLAEQNGRLLQICHVLRYTNFFTKLHEIVTSGRLGDIITVEHRENVRYTHMAHSFVRGNWGNTAQSSPMILAKCCHDFDILFWNLGQPVTRLQSFGSLMHFRPENAPPQATDRCTAPCPAADACPFDARRYYLEPIHLNWARKITNQPTGEGIQLALENGRYGRCVYQCDNDVVDHQTVNMQFASGASVVLFMHGHSHEESRTMRYDGSRATLRGKFDYVNGWIEIHDHLTDTVEKITIPAGVSGHGGGDEGIIRGFVQAMRGEQPPLTAARDSLESHLLAFAAEESRRNGTVIDMNQFRKQAEQTANQKAQSG